jgi:Zn finger protein HypA/HybF involved in hydrogenase expression
MSEDGITQCARCGKDFIAEEEVRDICPDCETEAPILRDGKGVRWTDKPEDDDIKF